MGNSTTIPHHRPVEDEEAKEQRETVSSRTQGSIRLDVMKVELVIPYLPRVQSLKRKRRPSFKSRSYHLCDLSQFKSRPTTKKKEYFLSNMIPVPEPDYSDSEDEERKGVGAETKERKDVSTDDDEGHAITEGKDEDSLTDDRDSSTAESDVDSRLPLTVPIPSLTERSHTSTSSGSTTSSTQFSEEGFVIPRKPSNPCLESPEKRRLHQELLFNQKIGKNVVGQKSELRRAIDRYRDVKIKRDAAYIKKTTSLEKMLEQQAAKLRKTREFLFNDHLEEGPIAREGRESHHL